MTRFWLALLGAFSATLAVLAGAGWAVSTALITPPPKRLMTAAFEMSLADGWNCAQEGTEHVCNPPGPPPHDSIAIIAMKYRNAADTLDAYEAHLRAPQQPSGSEQPSTVEKIGRRMLGGYEWVESLHSGSEIESFYTYYLATVTSHVGILVTLSASKERFDALRSDIEEMADSLVVYQLGPSAASLTP